MTPPTLRKMFKLLDARNHQNMTSSNLTAAGVAIELAGGGERVPPLLRSPEEFLPPMHDPVMYGKTKQYQG